MSIQKLAAFFMWCTIINGGLLVLSIIIGISGLDLVYSVQDKLFQIPREALNVAYYSFLGMYTIVWLVFNAVPYLALLIIRKE
ncbi:MAG: hypothetical protein JRE14_00460 [Deltaproteobacteria bacterium]|nr:hypothetical protein [Deltaproteobacteria bacterium]